MPSERVLRGRKRREQRRVSRQVAWSQARERDDEVTPLMVEALTIAPKAEREKALAEGNMVFYDGDKRITLPLVLDEDTNKPETLQGIYKTPEDGEYYTLRAELISHFTSPMFYRTLDVYKLETWEGGSFEQPMDDCWFSIDENMGHMKLHKSVTRRSLGAKSASKAERSVRSRNDGSFKFKTDDMFDGMYRKLHYKEVAGTRMAGRVEMEKTGPNQPHDNTDEYCRIEAIDPETGKTRIFTFTHKDKREVRKTYVPPPRKKKKKKKNQGK